MLHGGGWFNELRSNRWHFASFFAQHSNVLIAEASNRHIGEVDCDHRLSRIRILKVDGVRPLIDSPRLSAKLIRKQLETMGARNPILWLSSPLMWNVAVLLPEIPVVFHATEDFVQLADYNSHPASTYIRDCAVEAARSSSATLTCSQGVTDSLLKFLPDSSLITGSNGVSLDDYGPTRPQQIIDLGSLNLEKCAVFAGNINKRIDFDLLDSLATNLPELNVLLIGPVVLPESLKARFHTLIDRPNVVAMGPVSTPTLNFLYSQSAIGIVPYTTAPVITKSGFPLKTLEMVACGLPVVSTHLEQTHGLCRAIICTHTHQDFIDHCRQISRAGLRVDIKSSDIIEILGRYSYGKLIPDALELVQEQIAFSKDRVRRKVRPRVPSVVRDTLKAAFNQS